MNHVPFPTPQDADALNEMLDALTAGAHQDIAESDLHMAARAFHALAATANPPYRRQTMPTSDKGPDTMNAAITHPPAVNPRPRAEAPTFATWIYGGLVAVLIMAILGGTWLNQRPGGDDQLAWAPHTATPDAQAALSPESAPWLADLNPENCTTETPRRSELEERLTGVEAPVQSYGMVGPASADDANSATDAYRNMRSCETLGAAWGYWTDARVLALPRDLTGENMTELASLQEYFSGVYPQQFMVTATDVTIPAEAQAEWDARTQVGILGQPLPLSAKINPEWGVELNDGRVAFPATIVYAANDPAIVANGLPTNVPVSTVAMVFMNVNGEWKYDDSLALCLVNCTGGVGNPVDVATEPSLQALASRTCDTEPLSADDYRAMTIGMPEWQDNEYKIVGPAPQADAEAATTSVASASVCQALGYDANMRRHYTPLGLMIMTSGAQFTASNDEKRAYQEANHALAIQWSADYQGQEHPKIVTGLPKLDEGERTPANAVYSGTSPNDDRAGLSLLAANPESAVELSDGRIALYGTMVIDVTDRGAVQYAGTLGSPMYNIMPVYILMNEDGVWRIDEMLWLAPWFGLIDHTRIHLYNASEFIGPAPTASPVATPAD